MRTVPADSLAVPHNPSTIVQNTIQLKIRYLFTRLSISRLLVVYLTYTYSDKSLLIPAFRPYSVV